MSQRDPLFPIGARIRFADDVEYGDFVYFDSRSEAGIVIVRRLNEWEVGDHEGPVYRFDEGERPRHASLRLLKRGHPDSGP